MRNLHFLPGVIFMLACVSWPVAAADVPVTTAAVDGATVGAVDAPAQGAASAIIETANAEYLIQPGDLLQISVWKEQDLQAEVVVRPDGGFSFPLLGELTAAGRTVGALRAEIGKRIQEYIDEPIVSVSVKQAQGHKIYVIGQVNRPGEYVSNREVDVVQALSMAGGTTAFASLNKIKVLRRANGAQSTLPFRYSDIEKGRNLEQNIVLQSGDVVVVP